MANVECGRNAFIEHVRGDKHLQTYMLSDCQFRGAGAGQIVLEKLLSIQHNRGETRLEPVTIFTF